MRQKHRIEQLEEKMRKYKPENPVAIVVKGSEGAYYRFFGGEPVPPEEIEHCENKGLLVIAHWGE